MKYLRTKTLMAAAIAAACIFSGCKTKKAEESKVKSLGLVLTTSTTTSNIYTGVMTSQKKGIVGGEKGQILYTEDGGKTWIDNGNVSPCIHGIYPVDENLIIFAVDTYTYCYSTDGGKTLEFYPRSPKGIPRNACMISKDYGWIWDKYYLHEYSSETGKYKDLKVPKQSDGIECALVLSKGKGMFCDFNGDIYYTEDSGASWGKRGNAFVSKGKPVVKNLFSTTGIDLKDGVIRVASVVLDSGAYYLAVSSSSDEGKSFKLESRTKLRMAPNSITFNRTKGISVFNTDRTLDFYEM